MRLCQPHPRFRHAGFRCASALRGVAGVATYRFTRSCYTVRFSMWQPIVIRSPIPFSRDRLPHDDGLARPARIAKAGSPAHACHTENGGCRPLESPLRVTRHRLQHPEPAAAWGLGASARADPKPHPGFPYPAATRFCPGHFVKAGSQRGAATQASRRLPHGARGSSSADGCRTFPASWQQVRQATR